MSDLVFGSPVTTMAILSRIETSRADEVHLRYGSATVLGPVEKSAQSVQAGANRLEMAKELIAV